MATKAAQTIDVDEVLPEEIPAELLERIADNHASLHIVALQVRRGGVWKQLRSGTRVFQESPPSMSIHDIACFVVRAARVDAEEVGTDAMRYRVRLRCRENGQEYSRYAAVRGTVDEAGALQIVDDENSEEGSPAMRMLVEQSNRNAAIAFQSLQAVMGCVKGFADIAATMNSVLEAAGTQWSHQVNSRVALLEVELRMQQDKHQHDEKMRKIDGGLELIKGPIGKIADEVTTTVLDGLRSKRAAQRREKAQARAAGNGAVAKEPTRSEHAEQLDGVFDDLDADKLAAVKAIFTADEWKLIEVARRSTSDAHFDATFGKFVSKFKERGSDGDAGTNVVLVRLSQTLGPEAMTDLGDLFKRIAESNAAAATR